MSAAENAEEQRRMAKKFKKDDAVMFKTGGFGVVKWANKKAVVVKFENGSYGLFDQNGEGISTGTGDSIVLASERD